MTIIGRIAAINRYPVKSMQGEQLSSTNLDAFGIAGDRQYALRDLATGKIVSAKVPKLGIPLLGCRAETGSDGAVTVTIDGSTYDVGECDAALGELLGHDVQMVRAAPADLEASEVYESEWPELEGMALSNITIDLPLAKGSFADLSPLHIVATTSIDRLQRLAPDSAIDVNRFRPGILIETDSASPAFVENNWVGKTVTVGGATLTFGAASPRCMMTTLPQGPLPRDPKVLQTIAKHNRRDFGGFGDFACLGIYADVAVSGTVSVGDVVTLVEG